MSEVKEITIQDVIAKKRELIKKIDTKLIMRAFDFANEKHKNQKRSSR